MTCELRAEGKGRHKGYKSWGKSILGRRSSKCKCPGAGTWCVEQSPCAGRMESRGERSGPGPVHHGIVIPSIGRVAV